MTTITTTSRLRRTADTFVHVMMDGEMVFMDVEEGAFYSLKETGLRAWSLIDEGGAEVTVGALTKALCEVFEVDRETCLQDLAVLLEELEAVGLIDLKREGNAPA